MFCENCGNQLHEGDRFCQKCGARVPEEMEWRAGADIRGYSDEQIFQQSPVPEMENQWIPESAERYVPEGGKKNGRKGKTKAAAAVIVSAAVLIAAAIFLIFWFLPADETEESGNLIAAGEVEPEEESMDESEKDGEEYNIEDSLQSDSEADEERGLSADESADVDQESTGTPTGLRRDGEQVYMADFDIAASSVLVIQGYNYEEKNLKDLDTSTCWSEGASGDGTNETLLYTSTEMQTVSGLAILPGYTKSKELYDKNYAPAMIRIECGGRTFNYSFSRSDVSFDGGDMLDNLIYIDFGETIRTSECIVTIMDVNEGSVKDCCISEMFLYN